VQLSSGYAILRRWARGTVLERALVWQSGDVVSPEWGAREEGLAFSLERRAWDDTATVPSAAQVIDETTWPVRGTAPTYEIDDVCYGAAYPVILGCPGYVGYLDGATAPITPGSPAYLADYTEGAAAHYQSILMIAGHEVAAASVRVYDLSDGTSETRSVQHRRDLLGRKIAYIDFQGAITIRPVLGHEYRIAFDPDLGGGLLNRTRTTHCRGAGELVRRLLEGHTVEIERGTVAVDVGRLEAQRPYLDRVLIDTWISEAVHPWQWIAEYLLPILPADVVLGEEGLYLLAWDAPLRASEAGMRLDADKRRVARDGRLVEDTSEVYTEFVLRYAYASTTSTYLLEERVGGEGDPSYLCSIASQRRSRLWEVETQVVSDRASAQYVVRRQAWRRSSPSTPITYTGGPELEALRVGHIVVVQDSEVHLEERLARVVALSRGTSPAVAVELLRQHPQAPRRTA
jgi:hypothetical protein